jgi:hypothetical protein
VPPVALRPQGGEDIELRRFTVGRKRLNNLRTQDFYAAPMVFELCFCTSTVLPAFTFTSAIAPFSIAS